MPVLRAFAASSNATETKSGISSATRSFVAFSFSPASWRRSASLRPLKPLAVFSERPALRTIAIDDRQATTFSAWRSALGDHRRVCGRHDLEHRRLFDEIRL